ncbi:dihydrolipoamide acyltransferase [Deinococcus sp. HMF7620]|uniref:Dihydrolipoamide acyltransferase n=1 Tax=Deinococcus arboris TaxID=2682977 RepID=A0A7C9IF77_9DEIO|nr:hotdog domain-containing protein [Deinococcus arboris]MVN89226.1 dihydrolipoamide acyltransferase [Deinococcus arboris]
MRPGEQHTQSFVVRPQDCAHEWGNKGLMVLSTPALIGHMESACVSALQTALSEGTMTVGAAVQMRHLAKADVNDLFTVTVKLLEVDGRKYQFQFEAHRGNTVLGNGSHLRIQIAQPAPVGAP